MAPPSIDTITYAAHTASCTFLLDAEGICRRIALQPKGRRRQASRTAARCVGAQYVASLDGSAAGGLVEMPRVGAAMLFARVDDRGRVSLVRTGVVTSFESYASEDPFVDSASVETSAPELFAPPAASEPDVEEEDDGDLELPDPDYYDPSDRTQRIQALRPEDIAAALGHDLATSEYRSARRAPEVPAPRASQRPNEVPAPRASQRPNEGYGATLRSPYRDETVDDDDTFARPAPPPAPSSASARGMLPRRSDPRLRAAAASAPAAHAPAPPAGRSAPRAYSSDVQVVRRRRDG